MAVAQPRRSGPVQKQSGDALELELENNDEIYMVRTPNSARRYQPRRQPALRDTLDDATRQGMPTLVPRRRASLSNPGNGTASKALDPDLAALPKGHRRVGHFSWLAVFLGMILMALLVIGLSKFGAWWQIHQDDVTYGRPRTFQMDAVVGHNDGASNPTHFIFLNLNRHVMIIEMPGGDASHARVYLGPVLYGDGQDLTPVTGEIKDVNGDGKPDLIVHIQDQRIVFINTGTQFRPLQQGEKVNI